MEEQQEQSSEQQAYQSPAVVCFGSVIDLAKGSGSDESDGCSSGRYDE